MLASSTHDTKRSEDTRARIDVLSEIPEEWRAALTRWTKLNGAKKTPVNGAPAPDRNDEYLLYQTLLGAWPAERLTRRVGRLPRAHRGLHAEGDQGSQGPHQLGESERGVRRAMGQFVRKLCPESRDAFLNDFVVAGADRLLRHAQFAGADAAEDDCPGVPDLYQGTELWDLSLVDPDNRRPVDYAKRRDFLDELKRGEQTDRAGLLRDLLSHWQNMRVKQYLIYRTLNFRRAHAELFQRGSYVPLFAAGKFRENICAFARRLDNRWVIAMAPSRGPAGILPPGPPPGEPIWEDGVLPLPHGAADSWHNILTGENLSACTIKDKQKGLLLQQIFRSFPVALVQSSESAAIK